MVSVLSNRNFNHIKKLISIILKTDFNSFKKYRHRIIHNAIFTHWNIQFQNISKISLDLKILSTRIQICIVFPKRKFVLKVMSNTKCKRQVLCLEREKDEMCMQPLPIHPVSYYSNKKHPCILFLTKGCARQSYQNVYFSKLIRITAITN